MTFHLIPIGRVAHTEDTAPEAHFFWEGRCVYAESVKS